MNGIETLFPSKTIEDVRPKWVEEEKRPDADPDSESFGQVMEKANKKEAVQSTHSAAGTESRAKESNKGDRKNEASLETVDTPVESVDASRETADTPLENIDSIFKTLDIPIETVNASFEIVDIPLENTSAPLETVSTLLGTVASPVETVDSKLETVDATLVANHGNEVNPSVENQSSEAIIHTGEAGNKAKAHVPLSDKVEGVETGLSKSVETPVSNTVVLGEDKNISQKEGITPFENTSAKEMNHQESKAKIPLEGMHLNAGDSEETIEIEQLGDAEKINVSMKDNKKVPKGETQSKSVDENSIKLNREKLAFDLENELTGSGTELDDGSQQKEKFSSTQGFVKTSSFDIPAIQENTPLSQLENRPSLNLQDKTAIVSQVSEQFKILKPGGIERVQFQLEPKTLGSLQIEIAVQKGAVVAHIVTADFLVKELLEGNRGLLRQNLAEQGMRIDKFSVDVGEMGASFYDKKDDLQFMGHRHPVPQLGESETVQLGASQIAKSVGLINVYV